MSERDESTGDHDSSNKQPRERPNSTNSDSDLDYMNEYIAAFNECYTDEKVKEALEALISSLDPTNKKHLYKQDIVDRCQNVTLSDLSSREILEKLQGFGLMLLITKVRGFRNGEQYVIPVSTILKPISESDQWGIRRVDFDEYPHSKKLVEQFAERIEEHDERPPIQADQADTPHEALLKHELAMKTTGDALDNFDEISVSVNITVDSTAVSNNTTKYEFKITGQAGGIAAPSVEEIEDFLKQKMTIWTKAATQEVESQCRCGTLEEHLQKIEDSGEGCAITRDCHTVEFTSEDTVRFETTLQNLETQLD